MDSSVIKDRIKRSLIKGAKKFLSPELREELGVDKHKYNYHKSSSDDVLNSFWDPMQASNMSSKDSKKITSWSVSIIVLLTITLLTVFFALITPDTNHINLNEETTIVVNGESIEGKIVENVSANFEEENEELRVENIKGNDEPVENKVVKASPILKSETATNITDYRVQYGDTLETICTRFYGSYSYEKIEKLKTANRIRNPRSLQIGQRLIIPF